MKKQSNTKAQQEKPNRKNLTRRQVSVTMAVDLYARFRSACEIQEHAEGQLARILIEWALPFYERARSVEALKYLAAKHFTSIVDKPLEQRREVELDLSESMAAAGGR